MSSRTISSDGHFSLRGVSARDLKTSPLFQNGALIGARHCIVAHRKRVRAAELWSFPCFVIFGAKTRQINCPCTGRAPALSCGIEVLSHVMRQHRTIVYNACGGGKVDWSFETAARNSKLLLSDGRKNGSLVENDPVSFGYSLPGGCGDCVWPSA